MMNVGLHHRGVDPQLRAILGLNGAYIVAESLLSRRRSQ
jgi:hypothetical protein